MVQDEGVGREVIGQEHCMDCCSIIFMARCYYVTCVKMELCGLFLNCDFIPERRKFPQSRSSQNICEVLL